jgi:hypothetical protein
MSDSFKPAGADATILASVLTHVSLSPREVRMSRCWRVLSLVLPAAAAAQASAQQPGSAGANRPKLEVLQLLPETQLFPMMNLVATSLGVHCDYCHVQATPDLSRTPSNAGGWVWDRDDKQTKRRAREMMKMVVSLNASAFKRERRKSHATRAIVAQRSPCVSPCSHRRCRVPHERGRRHRFRLRIVCGLRTSLPSAELMRRLPAPAQSFVDGTIAPKADMESLKSRWPDRIAIASRSRRGRSPQTKG